MAYRKDRVRDTVRRKLRNDVRIILPDDYMRKFMHSHALGLHPSAYRLMGPARRSSHGIGEKMGAMT
jgi:hypothetical protein